MTMAQSLVLNLTQQIRMYEYEAENAPTAQSRAYWNAQAIEARQRIENLSRI